MTVLCHNGDLATPRSSLARWQGQRVPAQAGCRVFAQLGSTSHPQWPSSKVRWQRGKVAILAATKYGICHFTTRCRFCTACSLLPAYNGSRCREAKGEHGNNREQTGLDAQHRDGGELSLVAGGDALASLSVQLRGSAGDLLRLSPAQGGDAPG